MLIRQIAVRPERVDLQIRPARLTRVLGTAAAITESTDQEDANVLTLSVTAQLRRFYETLSFALGLGALVLSVGIVQISQLTGWGLARTAWISILCATLLGLAMLALMALIEITFAAISTQARVNARNFARSLIRPQDDDLMDFAQLAMPVIPAGRPTSRRSSPT